METVVIGPSEAAYVRRNFWIYEHEWMFPAGYLGEPFLVDDCIAYFDGRAVNLVAFSLGAPTREVSPRQISEIVARLATSRAPEFLHVWGRFPAPARIRTDGGHLVLMNDDASDVIGGAFSVDIGSHRVADLREARKAVRSATNKDLHASFQQLNYLTSEHFRLIEEWVRTRPIGLPSVAAMSSLPAYVRNQHVELVEIRQRDCLRGFGVLAFATRTDAALQAEMGCGAIWAGLPGCGLQPGCASFGHGPRRQLLLAGSNAQRQQPSRSAAWCGARGPARNRGVGACHQRAAQLGMT